MKKQRIFWGLICILGGIGLVLGKLGYFSDVNALSIVFTVFLVGILIKSLLRMNFTGILFPLAFICIIYDKQLGITEITPGTVLLAALLGSIGFSMIFHKKPKYYYKKSDWDSYEYKTIDIEDEAHVRLENSFSGSIKYINTDKFEQADIKCSFGSTKVYFDNATLNNSRGLVRIDVSFAGVELYIPKTWTIENKVNVSFGGVDEKNKNIATSDNILTLVGDVSFAGVEIIYI